MRSKGVKLSRETCNLAHIIDETVNMLQHATDKQGRHVKRPTVNLVTDLEKVGLPCIEADIQRCTQVFYNLIVNALKFTQNGEVRITGETLPATGEVCVHVKDTGIGISAAHLQRIFEPFEQEDDTDGDSRSFEGIGLGLSIAREVVQRHGGRIKVTSEVER